MTTAINLRIISKDFERLEEHEYKELKKLTLQKSTSGMKSAITNVMTNAYYGESWEDSTAFIACDGDKWIGWVLGRRDLLANGNVYMMYVKPSYRRKKVGKKLLKEAIDHFSKLNDLDHFCCPWDGISTSFFEYFGKEKKIFSYYDQSQRLG